MSTEKIYPETSPRPDFPAIEKEVLDFWEKGRVFEKSLELRRDAPEFVFYDGPPFANGLPHYGHVLQSYNKDSVGRYWTMRGRRVGRVWGWDCHGLPPELKTEKELGISGRRAIEKYGVGKFVEKCRADVLRYEADWKGIVARLGRWADMDGAYKTMDSSYSESVMWAFGALYDKGLVYEDFRILPYSWAAETPLSNFEVGQAYKEKTDPAITIRFRLENGLEALVWTTTPWTLPSNLALAVGPDIEYSVLEGGLVLASSRLPAYKSGLEGAKVERTIRGASLVSLKYEPLFPYFKEVSGAFEILPADFVSTGEGTGIVHIAPGFGEDDFALCKRLKPGLPAVCPVDGVGCFTAEIADWKGVQVFDANHSIMERLKDMGRLFQKSQIVHQYPFCWRTDKPLIYKAMSSWFVRVSKIKDALVAENKKVNWVPAHIRDGRFGKWLEGARDWSISRNRFWGAPIPVWKSASGRVKVIGSVAELEKLSGQKVPDLHRPYIDSITFKEGGETYRRVDDVFDCWFESGAMPFASVHYPFENKEWFERNFPADFIAEAVDQTRGWFYTLAVLGVALFGKIPYKACVATGLVFDEKKRKLSKKLGNYSEPSEFFDKYGSDSFRWLMLSSPLLKGEVAYISKDGAELAKSARNSLVPFYNAYHFFTLYANADGIRARYGFESPDVLDRYIEAKLRELETLAVPAMDRCDIASFCRAAERFLDTLNNWYIRLSRERFWGTSVSREIQRGAFDTLYSVLVDFSRLAAPLLPFVAEHIYKNLTGEESVHLADYPVPPAGYDGRLIEAMDLASSVCSAARAAREAAGIRSRQPLSSMVVASAKSAMLAPYADILKSECNVKEAVFASDMGKYADSLLYILTPVAGPRLGARLAAVQKAAKVGDYRIENGVCWIAGEELAPGEYEIRVAMKEGIRGAAAADGSAVVALDTLITPALEAEGVIRDFMRAVQEERKLMGLDVSDRVRLEYFSDTASVLEGVKKFESEIKGTTLAASLERAESDDMRSVDCADLKFRVRKI